jgi:hypothetical protein
MNHLQSNILQQLYRRIDELQNLLRYFIAVRDALKMISSFHDVKFHILRAREVHYVALGLLN